MRKLNPFQMPQLNSENQNQLQSFPVASTSETNTHPCRLDKNVLNEPFCEVQTRSEEAVVPPCSSNPDLFNVVLTEQQQNIDLSRPRQYGRRSNPVRISSFQVDASENGAAVRRKKLEKFVKEILIRIVVAYHCPLPTRTATSERARPG